MDKLDNKVALITGGASGIGATSAILFASEGAKVAIVADKNVTGGEAVVYQIRKSGGEAIFLQADVSKEQNARYVIQQTVKVFGKLNILFNNAGVTTTTFMHEMTEEEFDRVIGVNLKSVFLVCKYAVLQMKKQNGGVILINSSKAAITAGGCRPAYSASKGGALQLMQAMAVDYAKDNIRVNALLPGIIDTAMTDLWISKQKNPEEAHRLCENAQPIKRMGTSKECAQVALFLISDDSSYVTGTYVLVDGGFCAQ